MLGIYLLWFEVGSLKLHNEVSRIEVIIIIRLKLINLKINLKLNSSTHLFPPAPKIWLDLYWRKNWESQNQDCHGIDSLNVVGRYKSYFNLIYFIHFYK